MKEIAYTITDPNGIHARPAGVLVKAVKAFSSSVTIVSGDKSCDMKKILALMGMGIKQGDAIVVKIEGEDEDECAKTVIQSLEENF